MNSRTSFYDHRRGFMQVSLDEFHASGAQAPHLPNTKDHFQGLEFDYETLLEYAGICTENGEALANECFPEVVAHLLSGCPACWEVVG